MPTSLARALAPAPADGLATRTLWAVTRAWLSVGRWWVGKVLVLRGAPHGMARNVGAIAEGLSEGPGASGADALRGEA